MDRLLLRDAGAESQRVGLDIGSHSVKGVEVAEVDMGTVIRSTGLSVIPRSSRCSKPEGRSAVIRSIKNMWSAARFSTRKVALALPASAVYTSWTDIYASDDDELDKLARTKAADETPFPAEETIIDYRVMRNKPADSEDKHFVMLVAAHSPAVNSALDLATDAGLDPIAVDIDFMASQRGLGSPVSDDSQLWGNQPNAHCIIGATSTVVTIARGEYIEFARSIPIGGDDFTECVAARASVDWPTAEWIKADPSTHITDNGNISTYVSDTVIYIPCSDVLSRLSEEILRSIRCFSGGFPEGSYLGTINSVTVSGGGSMMSGLCEALRSHGVELRRETGVGHFSLPTAQTPLYSTALGLALGGYGSQKLN